MVLFLSRKDVESVLTIENALEAVEGAFREHGQGSVNMPLRAAIRNVKENGAVLFMPAHVEAMGALGVKVVAVYPDNPSKYNLPTILGVVLLNDPKSGEPIAIMDGAYLTAARTGAASGVATKYLAKNDASKVGIIGTGVQGRTQIAAVCKVRPIRSVKAYDISPERLNTFCKEMSARFHIQVAPVNGAEEAVRGSEIVITSSSSKIPVVFGEWLSEGTHVNAIGSHTPDARELDVTVIKRAKLIVDSREAALKEAGDIMIPIAEGIISQDHIHAELGEVITGKKNGRESDREITVFKSQGLAIQDVSTARKVYELAVSKGTGKELDL